VNKFSAKLAKYNDGLRYYQVVPSDKALAEDGKYLTGDNAGYAIENKMTKVVEHTTVCLPAAMFQANHFDDMLASLIDGTPKLSVVDSVTEDIVPN